MSSGQEKFYDEHTIYIDTSVATEKQVIQCTKEAIEQAEHILNKNEKTTENNRCKFRVNLIVGKDGSYFGFGYIRISDPSVYWLLLGHNADGSERVEEYPDPDWRAPDNTKNKNENKTWFDMVQAEDAHICPILKRQLPPLVTMPGYEYNEEQKAHLLEIQEENNDIPSHGYFILSRAYALEPGPEYAKNKLCARNVPDWIPLAAFKSIFSFYVSDKSKRGKVGYRSPDKKYMEIEDTYPIVNFLDSKKGGKMVFITFDPATKDAIFALLMNRKTRIAHPQDDKKRAVLIFTHALALNNKKI